MKQESIKVMQDNLDNLITKYDLLIKGNNYNEALNVMKNVEIILRQLKELGVSAIKTDEIDSKSEFLDWYNVLKFFIDTKQSQLIQLDDSSNNAKKHRGTGKTSTLLKLSNDYNIPIYTDNYSLLASEFKKKADSLGLHISVLDYKMLNMKQYENIELLLVDEFTKVDKLIARGLEQKYIIIGFQNIT